MDTLVSFDPGLREAGLSVFQDGKLTFCALVRNPNKKDRYGPAWDSMADEVLYRLADHVRLINPFLFVSEIPQVYREGQSANVDPADLVNLAGVVGAVIGRLNNGGNVKTYLPREWKGQTPKDIHNKRILARLDTNERKVLDSCGAPKSLLHNVIDSVGIGLFELGRMGGLGG